MVSRSLGVVPKYVREGDVVFVFGGGDILFVLRRNEERCGAWRLVGECYVDGLVHGFAMQLGHVFKSKQMVRIH